ncbi:MAG: hypothetical protein IT209_13425 [Armatimonadetes bacterium]|nr:hypothetical protein [Armatimonadota bacterium]
MLLPLSSHASDSPVGGVFTDKTGAAHTWTVNDAHALIWDSQPFLPVGGMFCSKYLTTAQTDENWSADIQALQLLKARDILDLYVNPVFPATSRPPAAWQKLLDYLDSEGFRYGIELADGPSKPLTAWILHPSLYRLPDITSDKTLSFTLPYCVGGIWALADAKTGEITKMGSLRPENGKVSLDVRGSAESPRILLLYPLKRINADKDGLQNFWEGYDEYRDRVLQTFSSVKFGPGLRFWVDPFMNEMGIRGESQFAIPSSPGYRLELEAWLKRRYTDVNSLSAAWQLGSDIRTFEQASQIIPLWNQNKGLAYVYNTVTGATSKLTGHTSRMWDDLLAFRNDSIRGYLNSISVLLKRQVANVPVVVKWTANHAYLFNSDTSGFDGIGVEAYGRPETIGPLAGAQCLAIVEQCQRPMWLLTTETQTDSSATKPTAGYASRSEMLDSLTVLRESGSKGFYVFGLQLLPETMWRNFELIRTPEQLDWLKDFKDQIDAEPLLAEWKPRAIWFSANNPLGADLEQIEPDLWWLPRQTDAQPITMGNDLHGYSIRDAQGKALYLWTSGEPRNLVIEPPVGVRPFVYFTGVNKAQRQAKFEKRRVTIPLTQYPVVIRGVDTDSLLTSESLLHQVEYLTRLLDRAEQQKIPSGQWKMALDNSKQMIKSERFPMAEATLRGAIHELEPLVAPFFWIEGEDASETNFDSSQYSRLASKYRYLRLFTDVDPPMAPYSASYPVFVAADGDYDIWLAGSAPGQPVTSPVSWQVDGSSWTPVAPAATAGQAYAPDLYWTKIATAHLAPGKHVVRLRVDGRRKEPDQNYVMFIDALVVSQGAFKPDGVKRPELQ